MSETSDNLIPMTALEQAAGALRVLAHPHRLRICELLMQRRVSVKEVAELLQMPQNAVSQHLGIMKAYGLVGCERVGKTVFYRVIDPRPGWLLKCIRDHQQQQTPALSEP